MFVWWSKQQLELSPFMNALLYLFATNTKKTRLKEFCIGKNGVCAVWYKTLWRQSTLSEGGLKTNGIRVDWRYRAQLRLAAAMVTTVIGISRLSSTRTVAFITTRS